MARPNPIRVLMSQPLPTITEQRRKCFRPELFEVIYTYNILNKYIFDNRLSRPDITLGRTRKTWGFCLWEDQLQPSGSYCKIKLSDKWFCSQWFANTLAHEMIHQYQWDVHRWEQIEYYGRDIYLSSGAHGPSFYRWRERFEEYGLNCKISWSQRRWFKYQDFTKS